jgi:hypothetical protein
MADRWIIPNIFVVACLVFYYSFPTESHDHVAFVHVATATVADLSCG